MKALLLAAGIGTRLRPLTNKIPKCLAQIHDKPLLEYWLNLLLPNGVDRILINTHYLPDAVNDFICQSPWKERIDLVYEDKLLGTGGTAVANKAYFEDNSFLLAHADNLTRFEPTAFISSHENRPKNVCITMMTFETDSPESCGIVELNKQGIVIAFHEKKENPPSRLASAAVYIFEPEVLDFMASLNLEKFDISNDVIPNYIGRIQTFYNSDYHRDIGSPESLRLANIEF